jgi:ribosomal protein L37AE/L43A
MDPALHARLGLPHGVVMPDEFIHIVYKCPKCRASAVLTPDELDEGIPLCTKNPKCRHRNRKMAYKHTTIIICPSSLAIIKATSTQPCDN